MGKDKIFLQIYDGTTFIEHLYENAGAFFSEVIISAGSREHSEKIAALLPKARIIPDRYESIGPMGGILSVYEQTGCSRFAVVPADVPGADFRVLSFFYDRCGKDSCLLKREGYAEPLIAAYAEPAFLRMKEMWENGNYRMQDVVSRDTELFSEEELKTLLPELKETDLSEAFFNINTEQEYISRKKE